MRLVPRIPTDAEPGFGAMETVVAAAFIVIANLIVDVLYAVVDPRVRLA